MSYKRFMQLMSCLHFSHTPTASVTWKIDALHQLLMTIFQRYWAPGRYLAIDEGMVPFKGTCINILIYTTILGAVAFRMHLPCKPDDTGIKILMMCDSDGYIINSFIYTGSLLLCASLTTSRSS